MENAGILIGRGSPFWGHFPTLGKEIANDARTRAILPLLPVIATGGQFLDGWSVNDRYETAVTDMFSESRYLTWQTDVEALFFAVGVP